MTTFVLLNLRSGICVVLLMLSGEVRESSFCENRNQESLFFHVQIDGEEIFSQKGFAAGNESPQGTQGHGFINEFLYLLKGKLPVFFQLINKCI